ncbi:amidophosphoribosyltransferase [Chitinispirillales bacterium ANBcel5]|uniref:amidophosphoribosyltransferase n=1 Tax=Cellulosispirillum alkaliphilum TaxID=3039283 RepID=UPI002A4EF6F9|nr:amidophosphoribosyltransferase [Chitinispirillales bacterium ANBcel5]
MSGFFGVISETEEECITHLFYGTDYHSHLGTRRAGLVVCDGEQHSRVIHDISNAQFRSKFDSDLSKLSGKYGIGVISDYEDQPLIIGSHLGTYGIITVGHVHNLSLLAQKAFDRRFVHFSEMSGNELNPTELTAMLINQQESFEEGIVNAHNLIEGSSSMLILTQKGIYAARDKLGRTPVMIGKGENGYAVTMESCAFSNLGYEEYYELGPGEVVFISPDGVEQKVKPGNQMQMCSFLWIYYGYPASDYEGINVEHSRYRCGAALAQRDNIDVDFAAGIPDSGIAHALGYAQKARIPYSRPFVKYTPTWARSFMPQNQSVRELVAKMKLIPIKRLTSNKSILFCDDSIVRGTQLKDTLQRIYNYNAKEIHMRLACPPILFGCKYLNFSRSKSEMEFITRKVITEIEGGKVDRIEDYTDEKSDRHHLMIETIRKKMNLTSLKYQRLDDMIEAINIPAENLCTYCWTGCENGNKTCNNKTTSKAGKAVLNHAQA